MVPSNVRVNYIKFRRRIVVIVAKESKGSRIINVVKIVIFVSVGEVR